MCMVAYPIVCRRVLYFRFEARIHFNQRITHFATYFSIVHCQILPSVTIPFGAIDFFLLNKHTTQFACSDYVRCVLDGT